MDPLSLILTALAAGAAAGGQALVGDVINDSYTGLKALIQKKFAGKTKAEVALEEHETDPEIWEAPLKRPWLKGASTKIRKLSQQRNK